jgi:hypothetical protein
MHYSICIFPEATSHQTTRFFMKPSTGHLNAFTKSGELTVDAPLCGRMDVQLNHTLSKLGGLFDTEPTAVRDEGELFVGVLFRSR